MNDLGPLAWVLDELRKSLNSGTKALKRFAWDAEAARGSDLAAIDASQLRIARQQLHQAVGALEMVGLAGPVLMLRAMEAAVQRFVQQPENCSQAAVAKLEYASFALTEYLEGVLADRPVSAVSLFPQYRDVQELVRAERIHPADLWSLEWRWTEPQLTLMTPPRQYDSEVRSIMDQSVLQVMKGKAPQAAQLLGNLSLGFAAQQTERRLRIFWIIAAGYFEAVAHNLLGSDLYVRRVASRVLMQYAALAKGESAVSERLAHDLLFFCAQAAASQPADTPVLSAVRVAYGLARFKPVNYELVQFGRFDPALLAQARKRIVSAKEAWTSLCSGELSKAKTVADQFGLVTESLLKLHPPSEPFAQVLTRAIDMTVNSGQVPGLELAMEVATSVLYLEAVFEDLDPNDPQLAVRTASLAQRLERVRAGGAPQSLESWMEELYSRVSDKQTMGSVVGELRTSLGELEKSLDAFFRNPADKSLLQTVPGQLSQMRGVLSVLGLEQACKAVLRMRTSVQQMIDTHMNEESMRAAGTFEHLGNNLGALSFLIDMLNYQPALAKKLFIYDEEKGELKPVMGRASDTVAAVPASMEPAPQVVAVVLPEEAKAAPASAPVMQHAAPAAVPAPPVPSPVPASGPGALDLAMDFDLAPAPAAVPAPPAPAPVPASDPGMLDLTMDFDLTPAPAAVPAPPAPAPASDLGMLDLTMDFDLAPAVVAPVGDLPLPDFAPAAVPPQVVSTPAAPVGQPSAAQMTRDPVVPPSIRQADPVVSAPAAAPVTLAPAPVVPAPPAPVDMGDDDDDFDLLDIFLEEAREVIGNATQAIDALAENPSDGENLTILRRAFHTLKGSSRMVGLTEFGEAGWAMEQMLNSWLADQKAATKEFRTLSSEAIAGFGAWVDAIADRQDGAWSAAPFRASAEAMRIEGRYRPLILSGQSPDEPTPAPAAPAVTPQTHEQPPVDVPATPPQAPSDALSPAGFALPEEQEAMHAMALDIVSAAEPVQAVEAARPVGIVETPAAVDAPETDTFVTELGDADFDNFFTFEAQEEALPAVEPSAQEAPATVSPEPVSVQSIELSDDDFMQQFQIGMETAGLQSEPPVMAESVQPVPEPVRTVEPAMPEIFAPAHEEQVAQRPENEPDSVALPESQPEENITVIGSLRIGTPLYNVYVGEADQWSSRLVQEVTQWARESHQLVSSSTVALAHSLGGSSATVGFHALSELARALEHALQNSRDHLSYDASDYRQIFVDAANEIRRLLHQFAAGFLRQPQADIVERLKHLEFPDAVVARIDERNPYESSDFADFDETMDGLSELLAEPEVAFDIEPAPVSQTAVPPVTPVDLEIDSEFMMEFSPVQAQPAPVTAEFLASSPQSPAPTPAALPVWTPPAPAPVAIKDLDIHPGVDDDIDAVDAIDPDLFPIFEEECAELMPRLSGSLRQWAEQPDNQGARLQVLRALHTLKGSARLAGALRLGEMAHRIESEIEHVGSDAAESQEFEPLLTRLDGVQATFDALRRMDVTQEAPSVAPLERPLFVQPEPAPAPAPAAGGLERDELAAFSAAAAVPAAAPAPAEGRFLIPAPQAMVMQSVRQASTASIRVRSQLLDRMVNQAGEVMITRSRLEAEVAQLRESLNDMSINLTRLRQQLRDIELQAETQMQSRLALAKEAQAGFDPLEFDRFTRVQELTRMMAESVNDVATVQRTLQRTIEATEDDLVAQARQTRELQRDLLRTRMVEFEGISERLYRVVRQTSKEIGKQVRLDLLGGTLEMDRGMLDRMVPAFEHLLRNCVTHGIEMPEVRVAAGKDPVGLISIHLRQEGNDVSVEFSDDGAGLNLARIREIAIKRGLITPDQGLDDAAAANLIFLPGFSTATAVTEIAGRGIGMEVVRSEVNALGGRIETSTVAGKGSNFKLVLPLTTAVTQVVMIRADKLAVGVPTNVVEVVRRISAKELQQAYNSGTLDVAGEAVPFFWAGALLQASHHSSETQAKSTPVVVFRSAAQRIALHVDEVLGNREVVVKNLGPQLSRLPGMAGMSVLPSGAVVLIYNPVALAAVYGQQARAWSADRAEPHMLEGVAAGNAVKVPALMPAVPKIPLILVVDDSITVRRVTQRLLLRDGYRVALAADGLQALERLRDELPAVVLSDIEMPRMDGFDLARNIRGDERLKALPIIMITSRIAEKHHEHAKDLGVDHYLGKPYSEDELMKLVRHYCTLDAATVSA